MANALKQGVNTIVSVFGVRTEEQPPYSVVEKIGDVEIRQYGPRLAAETTVAAPTQAEGRNQAFGRLANYIFGGNRGEQQIAMTAPVASEPGRQIAMTAPVETARGPDNRLTMRFFMPAAITANNAPAPLDDQVRIITVPAEHIAALRFSGSWSDAVLKDQEQKLLAALEGSGWSAAGRPFSQLYDPPFAIPFLRRNESAVRVTRN
jgi:SOUL heme-binding protein